MKAPCRACYCSCHKKTLEIIADVDRGGLACVDETVVGVEVVERLEKTVRIEFENWQGQFLFGQDVL
jgi:hypothetical protein